MFAAAIFDWDGTLADTRRVITTTFQKTLEEEGVHVPDEFIERRIGIGVSETFRQIYREAKLPFDEALISRLEKRKSELELELSSQVSIFEGTRELLDALYGKLPLALASMGNRNVVVPMLEATGLKKYFQATLMVESITHFKPDPEIFLLAAKKLNVAPAKCVVVEDSVFGIQAAKSANMKCVAVATGVYSEAELKQEKPDLIVKTLKDRRIVPFILQ